MLRAIPQLCASFRDRLAPRRASNRGTSLNLSQVFYALIVAAVIVMRRRAPQAERPYRTSGYPLAPLVYIALATLVVLDLLFVAPSTSGLVYLLVFTGIPVYFIWRGRAAPRLLIRRWMSPENFAELLLWE